MQKRHTTYLILFLLFVLFSGFFYQRMTTPRLTSAPAGEQVVGEQPTDNQAVLRHQLTSEVEVSALDLVKSKLNVEFKTYDFGLMLEAVDDLRADTGHYWAIYYNGEYAKVGLSELMIGPGDVLELVYEEIVF